MALHFNSDSGTDDYLNKSVAIFSGKTYPLTFAAWVRPDDKGPNMYAVASDSGSGSSKQITLGTGGSGKFRTSQKGHAVTSGVYYDNSNTTWFHILSSYEAADDVKLYVNGSLDGTISSGSGISDFADSNQFYIGTGILSGSDLTSRTWEGGIAEVAAYAAQLTAGEISALANGFSPLFVRPSALVGYWPLGGAYSNDNMDLIGGNTLTANGGASVETHPRIIYPSGPSTYDFAAPVVEEEEPAAERGWMFESMQIAVGAGGRRRLSPPNTRTASTNKGWAIESLQVGVSRGGSRTK